MMFGRVLQQSLWRTSAAESCKAFEALEQMYVQAAVLQTLSLQPDAGLDSRKNTCRPDLLTKASWCSLTNLRQFASAPPQR